VTLLYVGNSEGCVGRCDAKCYEAQHPECDCICGGKNHGVGLQVARENVERDFLGDTLAHLAADFSARHGVPVTRVEVLQAALPGLFG
jgi:hypothetical protein